MLSAEDTSGSSYAVLVEQATGAHLVGPTVAGARGRDLRRVLLQDRGHALGRRLAPERLPPGQHLVEYRT